MVVVGRWLLLLVVVVGGGRWLVGGCWLVDVVVVVVVCVCVCVIDVVGF